MKNYVLILKNKKHNSSFFSTQSDNRLVAHNGFEVSYSIPKKFVYETKKF